MNSEAEQLTSPLLSGTQNVISAGWEYVDLWRQKMDRLLAQLHIRSMHKWKSGTCYLNFSIDVVEWVTDFLEVIHINSEWMVCTTNMPRHDQLTGYVFYFPPSLLLVPSYEPYVIWWISGQYYHAYVLRVKTCTLLSTEYVNWMRHISPPDGQMTKVLDHSWIAQTEV